MGVGFRVYIDESGDEGFKFGQPNGGSSHWFVLSAIVTRESSDLETVRLVDRVRLAFEQNAEGISAFPLDEA